MPHLPPITACLEPDPDCPALRRDNLLIAVMHHERGDHLRLLMESIERNAPGVGVLIVDDGSADPQSVAVLRELSLRHTVLVNGSRRSGGYLGGLHANMNGVLDHAERHGFAYVFFVQDDQQIVRPLDDRFLEEVTGVFRSAAAISQVIPMFFKGFYPTARLLERYGIERERGFYYERTVSYGIADIGIVSVGRLAARSFRFVTGESNSAARAAHLGLRIVYNRNPVVMYTPWPLTGRDHPQLAQALGLGVHPFAQMEDADIAALLDRPGTELPIAEKHLRTLTPLRIPWWYTSVTENDIRQYNAFLAEKAQLGEL